MAARTEPAVWLRDVVLVIDVSAGTWTAYIHRWGELVTITEEDLNPPELGPENADLVGYQREEAARARAVMESVEYLPLPTRFEIREYSMMQRFCAGLEDPALTEAPLRALRGRRALRCFRREVRERGVMLACFVFRERALEQFTADWLDANGIAYRRG